MFEPIVEALNTHPVLRWADLLLLNELDVGMARSANRNVPLELSRALSTNAVFVAEYLELTKGTGHELKLEGENTTALHGNAILTRYPVSNCEVVRLPRCEDNFESAERRVGGRAGILLDLDTGSETILIANAHLDVVNTPRCRARQMRGLLEHIETRTDSGSTSEGSRLKVIVGGDFNTHTFSRDGQLRAIKNTLLILGRDRASLERRLRSPESHEPALRELRRFGYQVRELNDGLPSSRSVVSGLGDSSRLPLPMKWWVNRRVGAQGLLLEFRLDWLAARGITPLRQGEVIDEAGVSSMNPQTIKGLSHNCRALSDHDPIVLDISLGVTHCKT